MRLITEDHVVRDDRRVPGARSRSPRSPSPISTASRGSASTSGLDKITAQQFPEVFRIAPANSLIYLKVADWIAEQGFKRVAIIAENTDFGQGGAKIVSDFLTKQHVANDVVTVELNQQDFTPALLRLRSMSPRPDLLELVVAGQAQYQLVKQACQLGFGADGPDRAAGLLGLAAKGVLGGRRTLRKGRADRQPCASARA